MCSQVLKNKAQHLLLGLNNGKLSVLEIQPMVDGKKQPLVELIDFTQDAISDKSFNQLLNNSMSPSPRNF
jgi:hypothetical protein